MRRCSTCVASYTNNTISISFIWIYGHITEFFVSELPLVCEALRLHYPQISLALNPFSALKKIGFPSSENLTGLRPLIHILLFHGIKSFFNIVIMLSLFSYLFKESQHKKWEKPQRERNHEAWLLAAQYWRAVSRKRVYDRVHQSIPGITQAGSHWPINS